MSEISRSGISRSEGTRGFDSFPVKLGDLMRGERATMGKSLLDVQRELRIKASYISAIENCDPTVFQTQGFIAGYVRSYARYLGMDPEETFAKFSVEAQFKGVHPGVSHGIKPAATAKPALEPVPIIRPARDPLPGMRPVFLPANDGLLSQISASALGSILVLAILILGIGYGAWAVLQDIQRVEFAPVSTAPEVVADSPLITEGNGAASERTTTMLDQIYRSNELEVPVVTPRDGPIAALNPNDIGALVSDNGNEQARNSASLVDGTTVPIVTKPAAPAVAVVAMRAAWVRVSRADGTVLFEKILDGGESFQLPPGASDTSLRAGNSGAVYLSVDNVPYGPLGGDTSVAKNVTLSAEAIRAAYQPVKDKGALKQLESPRVITLNTSETGQ
ncbi:MAG: DUF4115 domain-containing protein [Rhodobacteraceae bacterium]|nr:DUF4115 domain-containing protein [Paracoccaceae bacterium]